MKKRTYRKTAVKPGTRLRHVAWRHPASSRTSAVRHQARRFRSPRPDALLNLGEIRESHVLVDPVCLTFSGEAERERETHDDTR